MNAPDTSTWGSQETLQSAIATAIDSIAPTWPLDQMIAVNPYWGRIGQTFEQAAAELAVIAGSPLAPPPQDFREAWERGHITRDDLQQALAESDAELTADQLVAALAEVQPAPIPAPLLSDLLDRRRDLQQEPAWCDAITHQVSQFCAAYFDREQADWHPDQAGRLYASWRSALVRDHSVALLMRAPHIPARASALAEDPVQQIHFSIAQLGVPESEWATYLQAVLMRVSGWAAWCGYLRWQARLEGGDDHTLVDLLAIRLSWETLLDNGGRGADSPWSAWRTSWQQQLRRCDDTAPQLSQLWQRAQEAAYQRSLSARLLAKTPEEVAAVPAVQAAFCIDVRSEVFRRHLEAQSPEIHTLGFAGFFGLPISYAPLGTQARRPQLPGLLAPALDITDSAGDAALDASIRHHRRRRLLGMLGWRRFQSVPLSSFTLVEALGLGYLGKLVRRSLPGAAPLVSPDTLGLDATQARAIRPSLDAATLGGVAEQAQLAARVLAAMGLVGEPLARLVLLVGHGSQSRNNPQRAGLDCGACCGQTGEVNARALAGLLNDPAVRQHLHDSGIEIPGSTIFIAGLHNTTTDEVLLYDLEGLPASHAGDLERVTARLATAGAAARLERAPALGLGSPVDEQALLRSLRARANDWAQTRPEWGLANNASFIVAPRARTRGIDLQGRSFLHDYDHRKDTDGSLLELIMTAPMIVTNWINMQYYASRVDNKRFGSGNKTLHNVAGGRIGVFEGNGGDLRIGLPLQSLHDGERWRHAPLRLTVVIAAPRAAIDTVIARHGMVRQLLDNRWLYLLRLDGDRMEAYRNGRWQAGPA